MCALVVDDELSIDAFQTVSEFYHVDIEMLMTEHNLFCNFKILQEINNNSSVSDIFKLSLVSAETLAMVLTLGKIIQIFGVISGTSCEAERSTCRGYGENN